MIVISTVGAVTNLKLVASVVVVVVNLAFLVIVSLEYCFYLLLYRCC
jgi:hypothetical protein